MKPEHIDSWLALLHSAPSAENVETIEKFLAEELGEPLEKPLPAANDRWLVPTLGEVAGFFDVHLQTVKQWRTEASPMPGEPGRWNLQDISRWRFEKLSTRQPASGGDQPPRGKERLECRKLRIENARRQLKLDQEEARLVSREAWNAAAEQLFHRIRVRLQAIPDELCTTLPPEMLTDTVCDWKSKIDLILREMASWRPPEE